MTVARLAKAKTASSGTKKYIAIWEKFKFTLKIKNSAKKLLKSAISPCKFSAISHSLYPIKCYPSKKPHRICLGLIFLPR